MRYGPAPPALRARIVRECQAQIDDRHVVGPEIRNDDLPSIGRPGDREGPRLAVGIVSSYTDAGGLGSRRAGARAVDVADGDGVPLEVHLPAFARGHRDG